MSQKDGKKSMVKGAVTIALGATLFGGISGVTFNTVTGGSSTKSSIRTSFEENLIKNGFRIPTNEDDLADNDSAGSAIDPSFSLPTTTFDGSDLAKSQSLDVSDIAEGVMPAIVSVNVKATQEVPDYFGFSQQYEVEGCGSGIIIGETENEIFIITNNHVVEGATELSVGFIDESSCSATVKNVDEDNDLAVVIVNKKDVSSDTLNQIAVAKLGDSDTIKVGEQVVAIGNALGYGQSVTTGIVSAKNCMNSTNATALIQTDAAITPGNSGGALLNMKGEVIGINSSKYASTDVEGMGFAIPISSVESIISDLMTQDPKEKLADDERGYLGISCGTISEEYSAVYGMPVGVLITDFQDESAAKKAGLKKNDVITKIDGKAVKSAESLIDKLEYYPAGTKVTITYQTLEGDAYVERETEVILGSKQ